MKIFGLLMVNSNLMKLLVCLLSLWMKWCWLLIFGLLFGWEVVDVIVFSWWWLGRFCVVCVVDSWDFGWSCWRFRLVVFCSLDMVGSCLWRFWNGCLMGFRYKWCSCGLCCGGLGWCWLVFCCGIWCCWCVVFFFRFLLGRSSGVVCLVWGIWWRWCYVFCVSRIVRLLGWLCFLDWGCVWWGRSWVFWWKFFVFW